MHVRTDALRFAVDDRKSTYSSQAAIVVRVRNGSGQEVQKLSQRYQLSGDARDVEAARQGDIIFYREVDLEPGVYTIESVVFDAGAHHGSARVTTLNVPTVDRRDASMSSLVLVNRIEETSDTPETQSSSRPPLYVGRTLLYPNLGEPVSKAAVKELPFYFTLYGSVSGRDSHGAAAAQRSTSRRSARSASSRHRSARPAYRQAADCRSAGRDLRAEDRREDGGQQLHGRLSSRWWIETNPKLQVQPREPFEQRGESPPTSLLDRHSLRCSNGFPWDLELGAWDLIYFLPLTHTSTDDFATGRE